MAEGTIKLLTRKGVGVIDCGPGSDLLFYASGLKDAKFEDLFEGQRVSYRQVRTPDGPRAESVEPLPPTGRADGSV